MWIGCFLSWMFLGIASGETDIKSDSMRRVSSSWLQFRGENGAGLRRDARHLPVDLDSTGQTGWSVNVPEGHSSPIVIGQWICLTGFEDRQLITSLFDRASGKLRWRRVIEVSQFEKFHPQHGPASATPTSDGQRIFAWFGSFGLIAYDLEGNELWRRNEPILHNTFGSASSPILVDGRLIVFSGSDQGSRLQALRPESGELIWERRRENAASSWSTPSVWRSGSQTALLVYEPFTLIACDWADGADLWAVPGLADEPITLPQVGSELIYTSSYNLRTNREASGLPTFDQLLAECDSDQDGKLSAAEAKRNQSILSRPDADGQGDHPLSMFFRMLDENRNGTIEALEWPRIHSWMESWNHANGIIALRPGSAGQTPEFVWQHELGVPECPTPILVDDRLYAIRNGGVVTCLNARTGQRLFQERLAAGGPYYASPVSGDGKIYLVSGRGQVTVLSATDQLQVLSTHALNEPVSASPALTESQILIRGQKTLWCFQANSSGQKN